MLKIKKLHPDAEVPEYAHETDSGLDLRACEDLTINPGDWELVPTGIAIELLPGTEAQIRSRSGLALGYGVAVLNSPGTVDEGYRGEIRVILINHSKEWFKVKKGAKIAQMVIAPVLRPEIEIVEELGESARGEAGFGSTGL